MQGLNSQVFFLIPNYKDNGHSSKKETNITDVEASHSIKLFDIADNGPIGIKFAKSIDGCALVIYDLSIEGYA